MYEPSSEADLTEDGPEAWAQVLPSGTGPALTSEGGQGGQGGHGTHKHADPSEAPYNAIHHLPLLTTGDADLGISGDPMSACPPMSALAMSAPSVSAFWAARPVLTAIHTNAAATRLSPWALLGHALLRALYTVPPWVSFRSFRGPAALNAIIAVIGNSAAGKSVAPRVLDETLHFEAQAVWPDPFEPGSGEAIPDAYADLGKDGGLVWKRHAVVWAVDEAGKLSKLSRRDGSTLFEYLKSGWSGAHLGRVLANGREKILPRDSYRLVCYINAQPGRAAFMLSEDEIAGGFPQRLLWLNAEARAPKIDRRSRVEHVVPAINWSKVKDIRATDEMDDYFEQAAEGTTALGGHEALTRAKVAVALAVLDGRASLNHEDWALAGQLMRWSAGWRTWTQEQAAAAEVEMARSRGRLQGHQYSASAQVQYAETAQRVVGNVVRAYRELGPINRKALGRRLGRDRDYMDAALRQIANPPPGTPSDDMLAEWAASLLSRSRTAAKLTPNDQIESR